jgi:hypothetical protein
MASDDQPDDDTIPNAAAADAAPDDASTEAELERLRQENEELRAEVEHEGEAHDRRRSRRRRAVLATACLVVATLLLPVSVMTIWTRNLLLDTDRYVATVEPLAANPEVQAAVSARVSAKVSELVDVKSLAQEALPENAQFLAVPIAAGADNLINQATTRVVRSDQFRTAWVEANRAGHDGLVAVLTGSDGKVVSTQDGKVVLKLGAVVQQVLDRVDERFGIDIASKVPADKIDVDFVLLESKQLAEAQSAIRLFEKLVWVSIILTLGFLLASVLILPDRRKGLLRAGIGIIVGMVLLRVGFSLGRELFLTNLPSGVQRPDVMAILWDTLTRFVLQAVRAIFALGVVLVAGAWLAGPSGAAVKVRSVWDRALGRGGAAAGSAVDLGPVPAWVARHLTGVRVAIVAAAFLLLITWSQPTGKVVLFIALGTLVPLAIAQLLANAVHRDEGEGSGPAEPDGGDGDPVDGASPSPTPAGA